MNPDIREGIALYERHPATPSERPPIVLVHGGMHAAWVWTDVQDWLAEHGWRSVAVDMLSHGRSRSLPEDEWLGRGLPEWAYEIGVACASVADAGRPPAVIAHSMGGLSALAYAAQQHPLAALTLLCPVVPSGFGAQPIPLPVDPAAPVPAFPPEMARELFFDALPETDARALGARLQAESPTAVRQATQWTVDLDLSPVRAPTLALAAEHDRLVPAEAVRQLAMSMGATFVELPRVGHGVPVNPGWRTVMAMVTAWIEAVPERLTEQ